MEKLCVIFGGASVEHDISVLTAFQMMDKVKSKFTFEKIYLSKENRFYLVTKAKSASEILNYNSYPEILISDNSVYRKGLFLKKLFDISVMVNCCHGGVGEDGGLAAFCQINNTKLTSSFCLQASITMNKHMTKLALDGRVPTVPGVLLKRYMDNSADFEDVKNLGDDLIVKPNSLGSSIGVNPATNLDYQSRVEEVFALNDDCLIEKRIVNLVEYNQACFKSNGELILSEVEQPLSKSEILSFEDKYIRDGKTKCKDRIIAPKITKALYEKICNYTKVVYDTLDLNGVVRIDYIYDKDTKKLYFNEVNTVPGSLAFYLYEPIGIDYITLVENLINNANLKKYCYLDTGLLKKI